MKTEKLISVIIPVYDMEKYISQCLTSVINQSYKNLEIIVVNDGSKDRSSEIAKEYAQKDKRVRVYDYENAGVSVARNRGLELAKGEYISFVDSDDWLHPEFYKILADALETNNADIGEIVMDVRFPAGIIFEDNYASGMYIIKSRTVVELKDTLYYYRRTLSGVSKGLKNHPFDVLIVVSRLRNDLFKLGFADKRMDSLVASEVFRLIRDRGTSRTYRIKAIDREWYEYVKDNLSLRRKLRLYYLLHKMHIDIIP